MDITSIMRKELFRLIMAATDEEIHQYYNMHFDKHSIDGSLPTIEYKPIAARRYNGDPNLDDGALWLKEFNLIGYIDHHSDKIIVFGTTTGQNRPWKYITQRDKDKVNDEFKSRFIFPSHII
jgi:hypothetical protein